MIRFYEFICASLNHSLQPRLGAYSVWKFADSSRKVDSGPTLNFSSLQSWPRALTLGPGWRLVNLLDEAAISEQENNSPANILPGHQVIFSLSAKPCFLSLSHWYPGLSPLLRLVRGSLWHMRGHPGHDMVTDSDLTDQWLLLWTTYIWDTGKIQFRVTQDKEQEMRNGFTIHNRNLRVTNS